MPTASLTRSPGKNRPWLVAAFLSLLLLIAGTPAWAKTVEVAAGQSVIIPPDPNPRLRRQQDQAVEELKKHLELVTGQPVEVLKAGDAVPSGKYPFYVGKADDGDKTGPGELDARWTVRPEGTWIYGHPNNGNGTLNATYCFLEDQLGIRWVEPGDIGISFKPQSPLKLEEGRHEWVPKLVYRRIRQGIRKVKTDGPAKKPKTLAGEFADTPEAHNAKVADVEQWQRRMRMNGKRPAGGHAFAKWWERFGTTHPEYFALNKFGKREPVPLAKADQTDQFMKMCVSNPKVAEQVIADWLPSKDAQQMVDAGINDGAENFCECENCRALDVPLEGEKFGTHMTDRYIYLANAVAREARKHRPDAYVAVYAYLSTLYPPRKQKLEPNIVVQLVPYVDPLDVDIVNAHLEGWNKAGAMKIAFRPNYHTKYMTTTMPLGVEKQMFDVLKTAVEHGSISAEYDSLTNNWPVTGITDYILAKALIDPSKPFEYWEDEYCDTFGEAAPEAKAYFRHWREEVWNKRLKPNVVRIANVGGAGDFCRGLLWRLGEYYQDTDFDTARAILDRAKSKKLTPEQADRFKQLQLANDHAQLTYRAVAASPENKSDFAEPLMAFREAHKDDLRLRWSWVIHSELGDGDLTGLLIGEEMKDYRKPWVKTELFWKFQIDPTDVGLTEKWQEKPLSALDGWHNFRTDRFWERQYEFDEPNQLPEDVARKITSYDGIGWYATENVVPKEWKGQEVFLRFGAVDDSCKVYVNGKLAGERIYQNTNDWKTPFEIRIDPFIDWSREKQQITVRVTDQNGVGGIWRPVWIVSKK